MTAPSMLFTDGLAEGLSSVALAMLLQLSALLALGLFCVWALRKRRASLRCLCARAALSSVALSVCLAVATVGRPAPWSVPRPSLALGPAAPNLHLEAARAPENRPAGWALPEARPSEPSQIAAPSAGPLEAAASTWSRPTSPEPDSFAAPAIEHTPSHSSTMRESASTAAQAQVLPAQAQGLGGRREPSAAPFSAARLGRAAIATWLGGALLALCWLAVGQAQVWKLRKRATPILDAAIVARLQVLAGPNRAPQVLESEHLGSLGAGPFLCGLLRPAIVLPRGFMSALEPEALRAVLAHEAAHAQRRDLWWSTLARLACALLWPQPLMWMLARRLEAAQEEACDQAVLSAGCTPCEYAECLVRLAERRQTGPMQRAASVGASPSRSALARRVRQILGGPSDAPPSARARAAAALGAGAGIVLSLGLAGAQAPRAEAPSVPKTASLQIGQDVPAVAFSPDGKYLACGEVSGEVRLYDAQTRRLLRVWKGSNQVYALAWSPDSRTLANSFGELWDAPSGRVIATLPVSPQDPKLNYRLFNVALSWSPDGKMLASGGSYRTIMRRDESGRWRVLRREHSGDWIYALAFSLDGSSLAEGGMNHVSLWQTARIGSTGPLQSASPQMWSIERLMKRYAAVRRQTTPNRAELDVLRREIEHNLDATGGGARQVAFSPGGQVLAVGVSAMSRRDTESSDSVLKRTRGLMDFYSPNREQGKVVLWDVRTRTLKHLLLLPGASAQAIAFSPDGRRIAAAEGELAGQHPGVQKHQILIWDVQSGQLKRTLSGHTSHINTLSWSPDGQTLASGSRDKTLRLWSLADAPGTQAEPKAVAEEVSPEEVGGVVRDPDGRAVANAWVVINTDIYKARLLTRRTDASGRFLFPAPGRGAGEAPFECWASVYARGFSVTQAPLKAGRDETIRLQREVRVRGVVRDRAGRPVAGVTLRLHSAWEPRYLALGFPDITWVPEPLERALTVHSDALGRYEVPGVPAMSEARVTIEDPRFVHRQFEVPLDAGASIATAPPQVLRRASFLVGRVLGADGKPARGIEISAFSGARGLPGEIGWSQATSGSDGAYRVDGLPSGSYSIEPHDPTGSGVARALEKIVLPPNATTRVPDLRLRLGALVRGRVLDADSGLPLGRVHLSCGDRGVNATAVSDAQGRYSLRLPAGKSTVRFSGVPRGYLNPDSAWPSRKPPLTLREGAVETLTLRLKKGLSISGVALTSDGRPAPRVILMAERISSNSDGWSPGDQKYGRVEDDGKWSIDALTPGRYKLAVRGEWQVVEPREFTVPAPADQAPLRVQLRAIKLPILEGRVVTQDGQPLPGATLKIRIEIRQKPGGLTVFHEERLSDSAGRFRVGPMRADATVWLEATKPGTKYLSGGQVTKTETEAGPIFTVRDIILAPGQAAAGALNGPRTPYQTAPSPSPRHSTRPAAISAARRAQIGDEVRGNASIRGRVIYEDGRPARVKVWLNAVDEEAENIRKQLNWRSPLDSRLLTTLRRTVQTGADGSFEASGLAPFTFNVMSSSETRGFVSRPVLGVRARRGASVQARDIILLRGAIVRIHLADSKTGRLLRGDEVPLGTYNEPRFDNISMSSGGAYPGPDGVGYLTVPAGVASVGVWRNPDGRRPFKELLVTPLKGRYAWTYDLSQDDIEVSLDNGPRQKKRDGRLSIPIKAGQTRDMTFFLSRKGS